MKAILVIDIDDEEIEDLGVNYLLFRASDGKVINGDMGVILKPMPQKKSIELACQKEDEGNDYGAGLIVGWNDCLEALEDSQNGEDSNE